MDRWEDKAQTSHWESQVLRRAILQDRKKMAAPKASLMILIHTKKEYGKAIFKDKSRLGLPMVWEYFTLPFSCP
jgi:hypothetical protein